MRATSLRSLVVPRVNDSDIGVIHSASRIMRARLAIRASASRTPTPTDHHCATSTEVAACPKQITSVLFARALVMIDGGAFVIVIPVIWRAPDVSCVLSSSLGPARSTTVCRRPCTVDPEFNPGFS